VAPIAGLSIARCPSRALPSAALLGHNHLAEMKSMPKVQLAYGEAGLCVDFPDGRTTVIAPNHRDAVPDVRATLRTALARPVAGLSLREIVRGRPGRIAVAICDATRPQPRRLMIEAIQRELADLASPQDFLLFVATGTHRGNTDAELRAMLGDEIVDTMQIINHDARDDESLRWCGRLGNDVPVWLNRHWLDADIRITTGFVEPHFFAGFSGGPKLVAPGLAGLQTVLTLHDYQRIASPHATWGVCVGNPVHDDIRAIAAAVGVDFAFDVVLNRDQQVVAAFGGEVLAMHEAARETVQAMSMCEVDDLFDVVVTSNAGYPLDQNLYQAVKGISAAATVVKPGGLIICAAECRDGFPDHGSFRQVLGSEPTPQRLLAAIAQRRDTVADQWQVQVLARVLTAVRVGVYTTHLSDDELRSAHLFRVDDISNEVSAELRRAGPDARVCVLPEGPQTIPYLASARVL
jgi:nickel-dependent lactate racemase